MPSQRLVSRGIFSKGVAKRDSLARKEEQVEVKEALSLISEERELLLDNAGDGSDPDDGPFNRKCRDIAEAIGMAAGALERGTDLKGKFLEILRREIHLTCVMKRADAESGLLSSASVSSCMHYLYGLVATAGLLEILEREEWDEFNRALYTLEREFYDMAR